MKPLSVTSVSIRPLIAGEAPSTSMPRRNSTRCDPQNTAFALGPGLELGVSEQTANVFGNFKWSNGKVNQTEAVAAESPLEEIAIPAHESGAPQALPQRDDLIVVDSLARDISADLDRANAPATQSCPLTLEDVLIQDNHAETGLFRYSSAWSTMARPAMRMASAIAAREMLPWHSLMMSSQLIPSATSSRTSLTRIRVPRNVSWPWQIVGSAQMNRPVGFLFIRQHPR